MNTQLTESCEQKLTEKSIKILYTNWRHETAVRIIIPKKIYWGSTEYHSQEQWLLQVWDCERKASRIYALKDIKQWFVG